MNPDAIKDGGPAFPVPGLQNDEDFKNAIVGNPDVPGIEKISGQEVDYLMLVKTKPGQQYRVSRELRRRIKECFQKNNVQPGGPSQIYVLDKPPAR